MRAMSPFMRYQILSGMVMVGLYTVDLLAVVMTILTSVDTIAGRDRFGHDSRHCDQADFALADLWGNASVSRGWWVFM